MQSHVGQLVHCWIVVLLIGSCGSSTTDLHANRGYCADAGAPASHDGSSTDAPPSLDVVTAMADAATPLDMPVDTLDTAAPADMPNALDERGAADVRAMIDVRAAMDVADAWDLAGRDAAPDSIAGQDVPSPPSPLTVLSGSQLSSGFGMGVDTSAQRRDWVTPQDGYLTLAYPSAQDWGAVFISVFGDPVEPPRPQLDLSAYNTMLLELRGRLGGEPVAIGMKDNLDPDTGAERKVNLVLTRDWAPYRIALSQFTTANLKAIYIVAELVFSSTMETVIDVRLIQLLP